MSRQVNGRDLLSLPLTQMVVAAVWSPRGKGLDGSYARQNNINSYILPLPLLHSRTTGH